MLGSMLNSNQPTTRSRNDPPSAEEDVAILRLELRHFSLSELVEERIVNLDRDNHVVRKGPKFDEIWPEREN